MELTKRLRSSSLILRWHRHVSDRALVLAYNAMSLLLRSRANRPNPRQASIRYLKLRLLNGVGICIAFASRDGHTP